MTILSRSNPTEPFFDCFLVFADCRIAAFGLPRGAAAREKTWTISWRSRNNESFELEFSVGAARPLLGLLACQSAAFGDDGLPLAPLPSGVTAAAYAPRSPRPPSVDVTTRLRSAPLPHSRHGRRQGRLRLGRFGCGCDRHWMVGIEALWLAPIGNQRVAGFQTTDHDPIVLTRASKRK